MKKIGLFFIVFLLLQCMLFSACENSNTPNETPTEPPEVYAEIAAADLAKYTLICPARTSGAVSGQFWQLQSYIGQAFGVQLTAETDGYEINDFEILVGDTNREETKAFLSGLLWNDYGYAIVGNKLVIAGHTSEGTVNAIKHFLEHMKNTEHTGVFFSNQNQYLFRYSYVSNTFLLNGIDVTKAKVVVNGGESDEQIANVICDKVLELCGIRPMIVTDDVLLEVNDPLIIIGESARVPDTLRAEWDASYATTEGKSAYYVGNTENVLWIHTSVFEGYGAMNRDLLPLIQSNTTANVVLSTGPVMVPQIFSVMSFNVYVGMFNTSRTNRVIDTIRENAPSVLGVQEASDEWMTALRNGLGDLYSSIGDGRNADRKGEHSAIFYRKDKFDVIESGTKWLSATPDVPGSKLARANFPRVMTYAILERKLDGVQFLYVNTHLDHDGNNTPAGGEVVRQEQIEILIAEIAKLGNYPTIVTGDFNVTSTASAYTTMVANGYSDASQVAKKGDATSTYNGMDESFEGVIIDYIFVSPNLCGAVDSYMVCPAKRNGEWISDHNAIIATITLPTTQAQQ